MCCYSLLWDCFDKLVGNIVGNVVVLHVVEGGNPQKSAGRALVLLVLVLLHTLVVGNIDGQSHVEVLQVVVGIVNIGYNLLWWLV